MDKDGHSLEITDLLQGLDKSSDEQLVEEEDTNRLYKHLSQLEKRELDIIVRRYGLLGHEPMTQKEISKQLKISRSYVSRIEKRALVKLYQYYIHEKTLLMDQTPRELEKINLHLFRQSLQMLIQL